MRILTSRPTLIFAGTLSCLLLLATGFRLPASVSADSATPATEAESNTKPNSAAANSLFYIVRPDLRKCASPMCGGYFVRRLNFGMTRCANGRMMSECYVTGIDWNASAEIEINNTLIRGSIIRSNRYGVLKVSEVWSAANENKPYGDFYLVRDLGIRCIAAPCLTHQESMVNSTSVRKIAGVDLSEAGASQHFIEQAQAAMKADVGIIVAGGHSTVTGPAGRGLMLKAYQFYLRQDRTVGMKPCVKTGCSAQICADQEVISTCEYRPEYECYKKATCERQANGDCGFTQTKELTSCLAKVR